MLLFFFVFFKEYFGVIKLILSLLFCTNQISRRKTRKETRPNFNLIIDYKLDFWSIYKVDFCYNLLLCIYLTSFYLTVTKQLTIFIELLCCVEEEIFHQELILKIRKVRKLWFVCSIRFLIFLKTSILIDQLLCYYLLDNAIEEFLWRNKSKKRFE